jgi:hypothetical protein
VFARLGLVGGGEVALRQIDQPTVKAVEMTVPRAYGDVDDVRPKVRGGRISSAFGQREREQIWVRLEMVDGLIPSLHTFFQNASPNRKCTCQPGRDD